MILPEIEPFLAAWDDAWARLPGDQQDPAGRRAFFEDIARDMRMETPEGVSAHEERHVDSPAGPVRVRIFRPEGARGLTRIAPVIRTAEEHRAMARDPALRARWRDQLAEEDAFHSPVTYGAPILDASPFLRLARRSLAAGEMARRTRAVTSGEAYPLEETLKRMVQEFARIARADGQVPIVVLVQSNRGGDRNLARMLGPTLRAANIPTLATAALISPANGAAYKPDGHFTAPANQALGRALLDLLPPRAKQ